MEYPKMKFVEKGVIFPEESRREKKAAPMRCTVSENILRRTSTRHTSADVPAKDWQLANP